MTTDSNISNTSDTEQRIETQQVIVKLKSGIQLAQSNALQENLGASVIESTQSLGFQLWSVEGMSAAEAVEQLKNNPFVEYVEPNYTVSIASGPNDPSFNELWGINNTGQTGGTEDADIDGLEAYDLANGEGIVVGVIDTGVDYTHPDLINNMWTNPGETPDNGIDDDGNGYVDDYYGYDFVNEDSDPYDDHYHGTHVAGTIAAEGNNDTGVIGVAPKTQIMALKFLDSGGYGSIFDAIQAVEYATMMKRDYGVNIQLTNNSWGGGGYSQALYDAIAAAGEAGQLFIAAAGNDYGNDNDLYSVYPSSYDLDNIISVASTDHNDQLSDFSNYGATTVDLGAPGSQVYSTLPGNSYGYLDGTSMATPHVSGVASLIWSLNPSLSFTEVKNQILTSVDPIAALDGITVSGGRLNAYNALFSPLAGNIQGSKWNDLDQDGIRDAGEPGLAGWTIYLDENNNGTLDDGERSTVTNADGDYAFSFLTPGTYTVAEVLQLGWQQTYPSEGTYTVELAESQTVSNINFGNFLANPATISGYKWNDLNKNAVWDDGETGLEGWTIYLDANNNGQLDGGELSTVTDENGAYSFTTLVPGSYTVAEVIPVGWAQSYPFSGPGRSVFKADFSNAAGNASLDGFTIDNTGGTVDGLWHLSTGRGNQEGHSADDSIYFGTGEGPDGGGNYDVGYTAGRITSPTINLSSSKGAQLSFNYFLQTEGSNNYDRATVLISRDGGTYELLATNPDLIQDPTTGWTNATFDLSAYIGSTIQLQFDFTTKDRSANNYEGWYIDDVIVTETSNQTHQLDLAPAQVASDINFGNYELEKGEIRGSKWNDLNGNGQRDAGEPGLESWTIYLDQNQNNQLDDGEISTVTDEDGNYVFTELTPGVNYTVTEVLQPTWQVTYPTSSREYTWTASNQPGGPTFNWVDITSIGTPVYLSDDSFLEVSLPFSFSFYGQENNAVKISSNGYLSFGNDASSYVNEPIPTTFAPNALIAPFWDDLNPNDGGSIYYYSDAINNRFIVQYQDIYRYGGGGAYTFEVILNSDGSILYQYDDVEGLLDSATIGIENFDGTDGLQIAYNQSYVYDDLAISITPSSGNLRPYNITLDPGQVITEINFGNWQPNTLSGTKWQDLDGDGTQDQNESGLAGWTIYLDADNDGNLDEGETSTVTDESGNYSFTVGEGTYTIAEVLQTGWIQTYPSQGSHTVSVSGGTNLEGLNFGNQALPSSISGTKWNDKNANSIRDDGEPGLENWTIYLDQNQNGQLDEGEVSTVTDAEGNYTFDNLLYGTYTVAEVLQPGWIQTAGGTTLNLNPGQSITDINFGNWNPVTLSGNKWLDLNGDGIRDAEEAGLQGWTIYLDANNNGQLDSGETSTVTDAEGNYSFTLKEGTYTVAEVLKSGWVQTNPSEGSYTVSLVEGETASNLNFGNQPLPGEITGYKWNDLNANGKWDTGESGLADWTIYLDQNKNGQLDDGEISTVTDATGKYTFTNLLYGTYTVAEVLQPDWIQTAPTGFGSDITQLTDNSFNDSSPKISGNNVVWYAYDYSSGYDSEIYYYDGSSITQLTNNSYEQSSPQISGDNVVWSGSDGIDSEIYYYDGSNITQLTNNDFYDYEPQISDNNVVWYAYDYSSGGDSEIYYYNGSSVIQLTNNDINEYSPKISGNNVVWYGSDYSSGYDSEIYYYNGSSVSQLTNNDIDEYSLQISGNNVVWTANDYDDYYYYEISQVFYYDGSNITQLSDNNLNAYDPQISGNNVVWSASEILYYDEYGYPYYSDSEIYYYNGSSVIQLTNNDFGDTTPKISGNNIVWSGYDGNDSEIYYYDGSNITQLTDNDIEDSVPEISDNNIVWTAYDGSDYEIFIAGAGGNTVNLDPGEVVSDINFGNYYSIINGTSGNNELIGTRVTDTINGLGGNDNLYGKEGNDVLNGGSGHDNLYGNEGDDELNGNEGNDNLYGNEGNDLLKGNEGNDNLAGNEGNDTLYGGTQNDTLAGNEGNDLLYGEDGADLLNGNQGEDTLYGDRGNDSLYGNEDNDLLYGGEGSDKLYGNEASDILHGDVGNDTLYGGQGNDELNGGTGKDTLYGNENNDLLNGGDDNDKLYGDQGNDTLNSGNGNDVLYGNEGNDVLNGDWGQDTLWGGQGDDILTGGAHKDIFVLAANQGSDTITDYIDGLDKLGLSGGLTFAQLTLSSDSGNTLISLTSSNELLTTLSGVNVNLINTRDFVVI